MKNRWTGLDGWPCDFADSPFAVPVISAIRKLRCGGDLGEAEVKRYANYLARARDFGASLEEDNKLPGSEAEAREELRRLAVMARKLADHTRSMHKPAANVMAAHRQNLPSVIDYMEDVQAAVEMALAEDMQGQRRGAPPKEAAARLTDAAAIVFEKVTGGLPGRTQDKDAAALTGPFVDFLAVIFDALNISASVRSQVNAFNERRLTEK